MNLYGIICIAVQIIRIHSASKISLPVDDERLPKAAVNIVEQCFVSSESWTTLLIISKSATSTISKVVHQKSIISSLIVSLDTLASSEYKHSGNCDDYLETTAECKSLRPNALLIVIESSEELESILNFFRNNHPRNLWNSGSYLLIVLESSCNPSECSDMFKIIWKYWILNAVIIYSKNDSTRQNQSEFELYTFNPYSRDGSSKSKLVINETIPMPFKPGNLTHSWAVFERSFTSLKSSEECTDVFIDKLSNLDGYVITNGMITSESAAMSLVTGAEKWREIDWFPLRTVSKKWHFNMALVSMTASSHNETTDGNISVIIGEAPHNKSWLDLRKWVPGDQHPRLGSLFVKIVDGVCFVSRIAGPRPQWTNMAGARNIWIALGLSMIFVIAVFYMQNKSHGIVSAFLEAERLLTGNSVIHTATNIKYRIILGSIHLVVLVVNGAVMGRLVSTLTVVRSYPNLDTFEQLKEHNVRLYGPVAYKEIISDPQMKARYVNENSAFECLKNLEHRKYQRACLTSCRSVPFVTWNVPHVHIARTPLRLNFAWPVRTLHEFVDNNLSFAVVKLTETGLVDKFQEDLYRASGIGSWKLRMAVKPPNVKPIKLNDLLLAFMLLFLGLSAALITFVWETRSVWYLMHRK